MSPAFSSLNLVFLGPPGAGKGTQARILAERYRIPHIATGPLLRAEVQRGTAIGQQAEEAMVAGKPVSDQVVSGLVVPRLHLDGAARGFILDGYPRNLTQAGLLDGILAELNRNLERVLLFHLDDHEVLCRLEATRGEGSEPSLRRRLEAWREDASPVIEVYRRRGLLVEVDAGSSPAAVAEEVAQLVAAPVVA